MTICLYCGKYTKNPKFCSIFCKGKFYSGDKNPAKRPEIRKFHKEHNPMDDPQIREKHRNIMKIINSGTETNEKRSLGLKKYWENNIERKTMQRKFCLQNNLMNDPLIIEKIREGMIKKWKDPEHKKKYGAKLKEVHICLKCGKETTNEKFCSNKCSNEFHNLPGENAFNWKGGISYFPYCKKFNKILKEMVRTRDCRICQLCGKKEINNILINGENKKLSIHHIHYDKENCYPDLIALCNKCNSIVNGNRKYYEELFMNKLNEKELLFWMKRNDQN